MKKNVEDRLLEIQNYLLNKESASVIELSSELNITPEMIRRYLTILEDKGFLFRTHGGAILRNSNVDIPISVRQIEKTTIKKSLCNIAINYIKDEDCIFIDPSSTLLHLGNLIRLRKNLIIVTNCFDFLNIAQESNHNIFFLGGRYSKSGNRTEGQFQLSMIDKFSFNVSFFGADGLLYSQGVGTQSNDAIFLNENVIHRSHKNILVLDSSKFNMKARYCYANFSNFDVLITDYVPEEWRGKIDIPEIIEVNRL